MIAPQVRTSDVAPTILGLAGIEVPPAFRGDARYAAIDLAPWLTAPARKEPFPTALAFSQTHRGSVELSSVRAPEAKFIVEKTAERSIPETYFLLSDPGETTNLATRTRVPLAGGALRAELATWREAWARGPRLTTGIELDAAQVLRLEALGYLR